jgi:hypothetical protein
MCLPDEGGKLWGKTGQDNNMELGARSPHFIHHIINHGSLHCDMLVLFPFVCHGLVGGWQGDWICDLADPKEGVDTSCPKEVLLLDHQSDVVAWPSRMSFRAAHN